MAKNLTKTIIKIATWPQISIEVLEKDGKNWFCLEKKANIQSNKFKELIRLRFQ